jgi:hypothetical protein
MRSWIGPICLALVGLGAKYALEAAGVSLTWEGEWLLTASLLVVYAIGLIDGKL